MNTTLRLGCRYALYAMSPRFELEVGVNAAARDAADYFPVAAVLTFSCRENLYRPVHCLSIFGIHAKQIAGEYSGLVAACAGP